MRAKLAVAVLGVGLLLAAVPVVAHHSFAAEYDATEAGEDDRHGHHRWSGSTRTRGSTST